MPSTFVKHNFSSHMWIAPCWVFLLNFFISPTFSFEWFRRPANPPASYLQLGGQDQTCLSKLPGTHKMEVNHQTHFYSEKFIYFIKTQMVIKTLCPPSFTFTQGTPCLTWVCKLPGHDEYGTVSVFLYISKVPMRRSQDAPLCLHVQLSVLSHRLLYHSPT